MSPTATYTEHAASKDARIPEPAVASPHIITTNIIFDLGDVLFTWSAASPASPLPAKTMKAILRSATWFEYERGNLSEAQAYNAVADEFGLAGSDVAAAFHAARDSLQCNPTLLMAIREFKASGVAIYAMSNISAPDWEVLKTKADPGDWALFDKIFTSAAARERKPNLGFYQHVLREAGIDTERTVFVDDKLENVLSARSLGMQGLVFDDTANVIRQLRNICSDPVDRARSFLAMHKKQLLSVTSNGVVIRENFAQLMILEATRDASLVDYVTHEGQWNFFQGEGKLTTEQFPNDLDTTSLGLTIAPNTDEAIKHKVMDEMLRCSNQDGIVQVYFDHARPRIDPVVCVNVLTLFYQNGRGHELGFTLAWVHNVLIHRAYTAGTYYYATPETFLFFLSRLMASAPKIAAVMRAPFRRRVCERFGAHGDALALSMRILAAASVGLADELDLPTLLAMQQEDGHFTGYFYKYGSSGLLIGNDGVTTALAIKAIEAMKQQRCNGGRK